MKLGGPAVLLVAGVGLAGCVAGTKAVEIRAIGDLAAGVSRSDDLAVARGQLRLGSVGLALETFRKVQRDRPSDPAALAGIGDCYSAMGRHDLAQSNYEAALALAPRNPALLRGLAQVLDLEGNHARAIAVRVEAAMLAMPATLAPTAVPATAQISPPTMAPTADKIELGTSSITVKLPPVHPVIRVEADTATARSAGHNSGANPALRTSDQGVSLAQARPAARLDADVAGAVEHSPTMNNAPLSSSITVALPPVRPAAAPRAVAAAPRLAGPRLERLSSGEVALVTTGRPIWSAYRHARTASSSMVRWVPLAPVGAPPNVQVLNAARVQGLAASARTVLVDRGWRKIAIGDAPSVQQKSIVLYPRERAGLARSLAAQFGIGTRMVEGNVLVLVIGRDKAEVIKGKRS